MLCANTILCWVHRSANTDNLLYRLSKGPGQSILVDGIREADIDKGISLKR